MVLGIGLLSTMDAMAKWLTGGGVPALQILALRSLVIIPLLLLVFWYRGELAQLKPVRLKHHFFRGVIGFFSPLTFFIGIALIPLTDAVVVFFSSTFVITILSIFVLGEKVGIHRWGSIVLGFIGVLIVAGPKGGGELSGYLLVFLGSVGYAILFVSGRYMTATETVASLVFSFNLTVGIISLLLLPWFWQAISQNQILLVLALALFAVAGHFLLTLAFSKSEASLIAPIEYTAIIWAIAFDWFVWKSSPTLTTSIGAAIVIGSGLYIVYRERLNHVAHQRIS